MDNDFLFYESSRLAAEVRTAWDRVCELDRCGFPVYTVDRNKAQKAYEEAKEAERLFWQKFEEEES